MGADKTQDIEADPDGQEDRRSFMKQIGVGFGIFLAAGTPVPHPDRHDVRQGTAGVLEKVLPDSMYASYQLSEEEYIGHLDNGLDSAVEALKDAGYEYQTLSAKKYHPEDERPDDGSYRLLDPEDPDKQWHVHLWEDEEGVEVYSHYEYKPELWRPDDHDRVAEHYEPKPGETYIPGQHSADVKDLLEEDESYSGDPENVGPVDLEEPTGSIRDIFS